jgi:hypothetical protein
MGLAKWTLTSINLTALSCSGHADVSLRAYAGSKARACSASSFKLQRLDRYGIFIEGC